MKSDKHIKNLISKLHDTTTPDFDNKVRTAILLNFQTSKTKSANQPNPDLSGWRIIMKSKFTKLAVAAVIIIAVVIGIHHFGGSIDGATVAWADVMQQIYKAKTVTYKQTIERNDGSGHTSEIMLTEAGFQRNVLPGNVILIFDSNSGTTLNIQPNSQKVYIDHYVGRPKAKQLFNRLEWVRNLHKESGKFSGRQEISGKMTDMFFVDKPFEKITIWVDPQTDLPVKVEQIFIPNPDKNIIMPKMSLSQGDFGGSSNVSSMIGIGGSDGIQEKMTITLTDFVWNVELDESLFSLIPPEGYAVEEKQFDVSEKGENSLISALAFWTEMSKGLFPAAINDLGDPNKVKPLLIEKYRKNVNPKEEFDLAYKEMHTILKGLFFAQQQKANGTWDYVGDGVHLGDADKPVCWWKPEDSAKYRVIYGDLSIRDMNEIPQ